jgi:guanosine-3',5'-bis(diphosphate) 3'-pyrophosphohydrolase
LYDRAEFTMDHADSRLHIVVRALAFAAERHTGQRRKDAEQSPYINHPIELVHVLVAEAGVVDETVLCAAILHDTIEDTETTADEIAAAFGERVAAVVLEVSDDQSLPKAERKRLQVESAPHASYEARLVRLADKICNLRDMLVAPPSHWPGTRRVAYFDWSADVVAGMRGTHPRLEAEVDRLLARRDEVR